MTHNEAAGDVIDRAAGITSSNTLHALRHTRDKVVDATQRSHDLFFDPDCTGLMFHERRLVACYACLLSNSATLAEHYRAMADTQMIAADTDAAIETDRLDEVGDERLRAILAFTRKLILRPVEGNQAEIEKLLAVGLDNADVVTLGQLIGFLSYQIRVVAGLRAMDALESK